MALPVELGGNPMKSWRCFLVGCVFLLAGCHPELPLSVSQQYVNAKLYTCCNLYYGADGQIVDANNYAGTLLPLGTEVEVKRMWRHSVQFRARGRYLTLDHAYGRNEESITDYVDKLFVRNDPQAQVEEFPLELQPLIRNGVVARGMPKSAVLLSLGYPPTHATRSLERREWVYWNAKGSYKVGFDDDGLVAWVDGTAAPVATYHAPIATRPPNPELTPTPTAGRVPCRWEELRRISEQLRELERLREQRLITEEEYHRIRGIIMECRVPSGRPHE